MSIIYKENLYNNSDQSANNGESGMLTANSTLQFRRIEVSDISTRVFDKSVGVMDSLH